MKTMAKRAESLVSRVSSLESSSSASPPASRVSSLESSLSESRVSSLESSVSALSPLESEVIDLFVQLSRLLGHPCKIYNLLAIGAPILYIGPRPSHITEILDRLPQDYPWWHANHGDVEAVCRAIRLARDYATTRRRDDVTPETAKRASVPVVLKTEFSQAALLPRLLTAVTGDARPKTTRLETLDQ